MLISDQGTLVRTRVDEISSLSRNTQGVTLIKLSMDEKLVGLERVQEPSDDQSDEEDEESAELQDTELQEEENIQDQETDEL